VLFISQRAQVHSAGRSLVAVAVPMV